MRKAVSAAIAITAFVAAFAMTMPAASANDDHGDHCHQEDGEYNLIVGSRLADRLIGTDCDDAVFGFGGDDRIRGQAGYDVLRGGRGDDRISDPSDEGFISGGAGFDTCIVQVDSEIVVLRCENVIEV